MSSAFLVNSVLEKLLEVAVQKQRCGLVFIWVFVLFRPDWPTLFGHVKQTTKDDFISKWSFSSVLLAVYLTHDYWLMYTKK